MQLTITVIAINVLIFILQAVNIVPSEFAFTPANFASEPFTLITAMFMHGSLQHLLLNMLGLFVFGSLVEHELGKSKWLALYLASGFVGSLGYALLAKSLFIPALGASGAIFGLIGAAAVLRPKDIIYTPYGPVPIIAAAVIYGIIEFISLFSIDNIAHSAHLFGLFGGAIAAGLHKGKFHQTSFWGVAIVPIVLLFLLVPAIPGGIQKFTPQLDDCFELVDSTEETANKLYLYNCGNDNILTATYPHEGGTNLAFYSRELPRLSETVYGWSYEGNCMSNATNIDTIDGTAIVSGQMCEYKFYSMARACNNVEVFVIQIFENSPKLTTIDCSVLS